MTAKDVEGLFKVVRISVHHPRLDDIVLVTVYLHVCDLIIVSPGSLSLFLSLSLSCRKQEGPYVYVYLCNEDAPDFCSPPDEG